MVQAYSKSNLARLVVTNSIQLGSDHPPHNFPYIFYLFFSLIFQLLSHVLVVNQFYEAEIMTEYVIKGNAAVLKCSIPSFVADFVRVESWIDEEGSVLTFSDNYGVPQLIYTKLVVD